MELLPPTTHPADSAIARRHRPARLDYRAYRPCLRWEFGFTCAFCLLHERDFVEHGAAGTGLFSIEHFEPQSVRADLADEYDNCFYACRFCNGSRASVSVIDASGRRLLNPCREAWGRHFAAVGDDLLPTPQDADAARTHEVYDLDEPRKVRLRKDRRLAVEGALSVLHQVPSRLKALLIIAEKVAGQDRDTVLGVAYDLRRLLEASRRELGRFQAIPEDADEACRCGAHRQQGLPVFLERQMLRIL